MANLNLHLNLSNSLRPIFSQTPSLPLGSFLDVNHQLLSIKLAEQSQVVTSLE